MEPNCTHFNTIMRRYATRLLIVLGKLVLTLFMNRIQPLHNICLRWFLFFFQISKVILSLNMNVFLHLSVQKTSSYCISYAIQNGTPGHLQQKDCGPTTRHDSPSVVVGVVARPVATATCCQEACFVRDKKLPKHRDAQYDWKTRAGV